MSKLVIAVGTSHPPAEIDARPPRAPQDDEEHETGNGGEDDLPRVPADPADPVSPRPDDGPDGERPDHDEVEAEEETEAPAHRPEGAHRGPHQPVPERAALLRAGLAERRQEEPIGRPPGYGWLPVVDVERVMHERRTRVVSVARDEPPEERRDGREIRPSGRVGQDDDARVELALGRGSKSSPGTR